MHDIFARAGRAAAWAAIAKWLDVVGSTVTFLVMVRLLGPEGFGLFGMALLALLLPETTLSAFSDSLIQKRDLRPGHLSAIFTLQLCLAVVMLVALFALSPLIAHAFGKAELKGLVPVMAATLLLLALGGAPAALLQRNLKFGAIAAVDAAGTITAAVVGIGLGLAGVGVWAMVWMEVARRLVRALGFLIAARWRPSLAARWADLQELMRYSVITLTTQLLAQADQVIPRTVIAMTMGAQALGYFHLAWRIFQQGSGLLLAPFGAVALPVASGVQNDRAKLQMALHGATRVAALIAYPAFIGAAAIAPAAIPVILGREWTPAIPVIQLMLLMGVRAATASINGGVLNGSGRPGMQLAVVLAGVAISATLVPAAAHWGLAAVVGAMLVRGLATWIIGAFLVQRVVGYPARNQFLVGWESLAAAIGMAGAVMWAQANMPAGVGPWIAIPALALLGVAIHAAALSALNPGLARRLTSLLAAVLRRDRNRIRVLLSAGDAPSPAQGG